MRLRVASVAVVTLGALVLPASAAVAADAEGCSGAAVSKSASGSVLGAAEAPGRGATPSWPLPIDIGGSVAWMASTDAAITSGTWSLTAMGLPLVSGRFENPVSVTRFEGERSLSGLGVPAWVLTGRPLVPVSGQISGPGGTCAVSGYITGTGSALGSPVLWLGVVLAVVGLLVVRPVVTRTRAAGNRARGLLGGLLVGVGLALLLFVVGVIPTTVVWLGVLALGVAVVGLVLASVLPRRA